MRGHSGCNEWQGEELHAGDEQGKGAGEATLPTDGQTATGYQQSTTLYAGLCGLWGR